MKGHQPSRLTRSSAFVHDHRRFIHQARPGSLARPGALSTLGKVRRACGSRASAHRTFVDAPPRPRSGGVAGVTCGGHGAGVRFAVGVVVAQSGPRTHSYHLRVPCTFLGPTGCVPPGGARASGGGGGGGGGGARAARRRGLWPSCDGGARWLGMRRFRVKSG
jgi:hypothetical protein